MEHKPGSNVMKWLRRKSSSVPNDIASSSSQKNSVFRSFNPNDFEPYENWKRLELILRSNGGAFGIAGPRGSGKTWLISRGVDWARENGGIGLWFPTPSDYGAEPFLTSLADNFASEVQNEFPKGAPQWYTRFASWWILLVTAFTLVFIMSIRHTVGLHSVNTNLVSSLDESVIAQAQRLAGIVDPSPLKSLTPSLVIVDFVGKLIGDLLYVSVAIVFLAACVGLLSQKQMPVYLYMKAMKLKQRLKFSESLRSNMESFLKVGKEQNLGMSLSSERNLAERALTIASLIYEFRDFMGQTAKRIRGPVVIGIDELDKIHDPEKAKALLRDIKGIFEVDKVHFLVSVSDEAKRTLSLGSLQERDEFNSSFYTVIDLLPNTPMECAALIEKRTPNSFDEQARLAIGILGGGNLREIVRLSDICLKTYLADMSSISLSSAVLAITTTEARIIRNEVLSSDVPEPIKLRVYSELNEDRLVTEKLLDDRNCLPASSDITNSPGDGSTLDMNLTATMNRFIILWSKFRVRFQIVQQLAKFPQNVLNVEWAKEFQKTVNALESSAAVAEYSLEQLIAKINNQKVDTKISTREPFNSNT